MIATRYSQTYNSNPSSEEGLFIFFIILVALIFLVIFFSLLNEKKNNKVLKNSHYIAQIKQINSNYVFESISKASESRTFYLNSKRQFDYFDFYKKRDEIIKDNLGYYELLITKIDLNIQKLSEYNKVLEELPVTSDETIARENKMSLKSFVKRELKLGAKLIKHPVTSYNLRLHWEYTSPAGRNHYSDHKDFSLSDIRTIVKMYSVTRNYYETIPSSSGSQFTKPRPQQQYNEKTYSNDDIEDVE